MTAEDPGLDIDLLAASLRADRSDVGAFVEALAVKLSDALPGAVRVQRLRGRMFGPKRVGTITVDAGSERLELRVAGAGLECTRGTISGGIVLKSETLDVDAWLDALSRALGAQAQRSLQTRQALQRLLD